jgi:hypothetical protein
LPVPGKEAQLAPYFCFQFRLRRQMEFVAASKNLSLLVWSQRAFHDGVIFVGAKDQAEGRIVSGRAPALVVKIGVKLKLADWQ